ncbi:MAG: 3-keto-disaccharide hydrolase, partial [Planctomycetota bacterium]
FDLTLEVKLDIPGNSGIQFRSHQREEDGRVYGYQCEIDPTPRAWSGGIYDEARRGWLHSLEGNEAAQTAFKADDWNHYRIRAVGDHLQTWVNGVQCADVHDDADAEGFIALQVHSGEQGRIRWRNIVIVEIDDDQ